MPINDYIKSKQTSFFLGTLIQAGAIYTLYTGTYDLTLSFIALIIGGMISSRQFTLDTIEEIGDLIEESISSLLLLTGFVLFMIQLTSQEFVTTTFIEGVIGSFLVAVILLRLTPTLTKNLFNFSLGNK